MRIKVQPSTMLLTTFFWLVLAATPAAAQDSGKSWGQTMVDWAKDQFQGAVRTQAISQFFGDSGAEPINQAIGQYRNLKSLDITHGMGAVQQVSNGDSQAAERFFNQELPNDMLNMVLPRPLKDIVPNAQKLYDQMQKWGSQIVDGLNQTTDKVSGSIDSLKSYFLGSASNGMEPGSDNAKQAELGNLGAPANISSTLSDETYQTDPTQRFNQESGDQSTGAQASAKVSSTPSVGREDEDEDYGSAPSDANQTPNSERDTDFSAAPVAAVSMKSNDPSSCIKTSDSLGLGSVSIDCSSRAASQPSLSEDMSDLEEQLGVQSPPEEKPGNSPGQAQSAVGEGSPTRGSPGSDSKMFPRAPAPFGVLVPLNGSAGGSNCSAFHDALAKLAQSYVQILGGSICQVHRAALRLNQLTLQTVNQYSRTCAEAAGAVSNTEATIRTETQLVSQACTH